MQIIILTLCVAAMQLEEDTDRDRYMSPLEAKQYGLIDEVIGGDDAGFKIDGSTTAFPKTKEAYVNWVSLGFAPSLHFIQHAC